MAHPVNTSKLLSMAIYLFYGAYKQEGEIMRYQFVKVDDDTTKLKYKDKEFEIKKTVGLLEKLQKVNNKAKLSMMKALAEQGMTANDLIVERKEGNQTIVDKTNLVELEEYYIGVESQNIYDDILKESTGMTLAEILLDIDLDYNDKDVVKDFMVELTKAISITPKTPSQEK